MGWYVFWTQKIRFVVNLAAENYSLYRKHRQFVDLHTTQETMANKNLSFTQYRSADVTIFTVIAVVFEVIVTLAATKWFSGQDYSVSFVYVFAALVAMRWGAMMLIPSTACAIAFCASMGAQWQMYVVYIIGNAFSVLLLVLHKIFGKQKIRDSALLTVLYVIATFAFISLGRFLVALPLPDIGIAESLNGILYDIFPAVFALVVVLICRKQNGLFEDQKHYLIRTQKERDKELRHSNIDEE